MTHSHRSEVDQEEDMATRNVDETSRSKQPSRQGIGNPSISNVRWDDQNILVDWSAAKGATKHTLQLINEENQVIKVVKLVKLPTEKLTKIIPLTYGQTIEFVIGATGGGEHQESRKKFLIGGDKSVTNVVAEKDQILRREIIVQWKQPATAPHGYKLHLYEVKTDKTLKSFEKISVLEPTQLLHRFVELKSSTTYICEVIPIYDGEPKVGSFSNQEVTDQRVASTTETLKDFGKPEHIMHLEKRGDNDDLIIELSWSKINIGKNYKITDYHVDVSHTSLAFFTIEDFNKNLLPITRNIDVANLKRGQKYDVKFTTEYIDLDNRTQRNKSTKTHSFYTIGDESVTNVVAKKGRCAWREIIVSWKQPIATLQGYNLNLYEVKNDNTLKFVGQKNLMEEIQESHLFVELKSSMTYICEVIPMYNGKPKVGSFSNPAVTNDRVPLAIEASPDFGIPERIMHTEKRGDNDNLIVELSWNKINLGENYKILHYHVNVSHKEAYFFDDFKATLSPITLHVDVAKLQRGQKYDVKFTTEYIDLDDRTQKNETTKTQSFCISPSKPIITKCELEKGVIKISWKSVPGTDSYRLVIKDEHFEENMVKDEVISGKNTTAKIQTTEQLSIGRKCMIKVMASANNLNSESEWKAYLIGGKLVPRNVEASRYSDNPKRSILVTFAIPEQGPAKEYKITTLPEFGKRKTFLCCSTTFLVEYLRKGIKYKFHVFAKHGEEWSDGSVSNPQETDRDDNYNPAVGFAGSTKSRFDLQGAHFTGNTTTVNLSKGNEFGKVRDLALVPVKEKNPNKEEILKLSWKVPSFDNNAFDYKVEKYKVEIRKTNSPDFHAFYLKFVKDLKEYCTDEQQLELGETYNISVSTIYNDIDQDQEYVSNAAEKKVQTRPCQPTGVKCNDKTNDSGKDYIRIEWNSVKGAKYYTVAIHTDESEQSEPLFEHNVEKLTEWERVFDDVFGYGTSYHAVITAIGDENKTNAERTVQQTIGGDFVPKNVQASLIHIRVVDPNTEVYLSWKPPAQQPQYYEVTYENDGKKIVLCSESELLIMGLKTGAYYIFKVVAIHKQHKKKSGGCISNRIQTNTTSTQVKNVQTFPGHNPSTSINISWDKVDAENEKETTKYRVNVLSLDEILRREIYVTNNHVAVDGLLSGTKYVTTVAGGNSIGFGKDSNVTNFKTELGIPKNIYLLNNSTSPDTSFTLQFSEAEGEPINYLGAFNKCENQGQYEDLVFIDVQPGHIFNDLEPNTRYNAMVLAVFENERKGKAVKSEVVLTAPSKPVIYESGCCTDIKINSSKNLFLKWKSDSGCREHEIKIKHGDKVESQQIIENNTELRYSCMHEASRYTAQIRTKNIIFGQWSDEAVIDLAPVKLKNIQTELDEKSDNILIQCKKEAKDSLSYFCQALCNDKSSEKPVLVQTDDNDENNVKFIFMPTLHAEKYYFKLWAVDGKDVMGESSLTEYVISRPTTGKITKVENVDQSSCSDIKITWETLERCDSYEVKIERSGEQKFEICARSSETSLKYRCEHTGIQYSVRVRGIREPVYGNWSEKVSIILAPGQVELIEDGDAQEPVESVQVKWKKLETKPDGYRVILYNERKEQIATETETEFTHHVFKKLAKPGSLCYCTVAAYNTTGEGKPAKSQNYRIKWNTPQSVVITLDENNPSRRAKISWERPHGVTCFRLELENNQLCTVIPIHLDDTSYIFESGIPGNSYTIRLYSGCDGRYDVSSVRAAMEMIPEPPTSIKWEANKHIRGIVVTFKDNSNMKNSYEVCAESLTAPKNRIVFPTDRKKAELLNLIPGESYNVSLATICKTMRSRQVVVDDCIQTYPDNIKNLRHEFQDGCIIYKWGPPEIAPDEYIVEWRVNNEPMNEDTTTETNFKIDSIKRNQKYEVRIAASNTAGKSKMEILETTIPAAPGQVELIEDRDEQEPVETVRVKWKKLETKHEGYHLILYDEQKNKITETTTEFQFTHHVFEKLAKPGSLCYCTIAAYNTTGEGKPAKSQNYRIKWNTPVSMVITLDENNPSRRAKISWDEPYGANCFRLEIENNQSGTVITLHLKKTSYIFESGIPGNLYTIRLYSGCDGRYGVRYVKTAMEMIPEPPTNIICEANKRINGIVVTFRDNSNMKNSYEVCAKSLTDPKSQSVFTTDHEKTELPNLIPGESYKVSLVTICKTVRSKKVFDSGCIQTYPDKIKNLHYEFQDGCIIYKWYPPDIAPDEYIVQWRVNNEPMNKDTTTETNFKIDSIQRNQKYKVRIAASNTAGKSKMEILETTIPADTTTVAFNECKQIEPNKKVHDCVQELLTNKDQFPAMDFFKNAQKSDEYTTAGETPRQSKSVIIQVKKHDCTLSNAELLEIEKIIKLNSEVDMIEFCDCKIGNDYSTPVENQKNTAECKISKLIISYTDHFKEFSRFFYSTFGRCEIKSLCLVYANLDDQDVENLHSFLLMNQTKGIESLDISYSKRITRDGFGQIGSIIAEQGIKTLKAISCDLEKIKLSKLVEGLKNVNLRELDVDYNDNLTENGFEMLAKLVASRGIEILKLRRCQLTEKTIHVFYNKLGETDEKVLLNELDVSYNPEMNPACCEVLGLIIKKFGITTLNLAGCGISEEHLTSLMSMEDIKLRAINLRDNSYPGNIIVEIASIVSKFKIQELDISDCMFSVSELVNFRTNLNGTKLQKLHIGDKVRELGMEYIQEVCHLLQTVTEMLYLWFHRLDNSCRRLLNEQSEKLSVSIQLCDEPEATSG